MPKVTNLKEQVKAGTMTAKAALDLMEKRVSWTMVKNSRTGRWMITRAR